MGRRYIVEIVDPVAGVDRREHRAVVGRVEHFRSRAAGHEQVAGLLIDTQTMRSVLAALRFPGRDRLARFEVDGERAVLVLKIRIEASARRIDREALGVALEGQLRFLLERAGIEDVNRLVAW